MWLRSLYPPIAHDDDDDDDDDDARLAFHFLKRMKSQFSNASLDPGSIGR